MPIRSQRQDEYRGKSPKSNFPKFVCKRCGEGYYSATDLAHLHDPYCEECQGELVNYKEYMNTPVIILPPYQYGRGS